MMAKIPEMSVAKIVGPTISVGAFASYVILTAITVVGMRVMLEVFTAKNVIIERLASDRFWFSDFICSIALMPSGVAAFPNPKKLAIKFDKMYPIAG